MALVGKSTSELGSCIYSPLWRAAAWQLVHSRVGGRLATTTIQSEAFSESLLQAPRFSSWAVGQLVAPTSAYMCVLHPDLRATKRMLLLSWLIDVWALALCCQGPFLEPRVRDGAR